MQVQLFPKSTRWQSDVLLLICIRECEIAWLSGKATHRVTLTTRHAVLGEAIKRKEDGPPVMGFCYWIPFLCSSRVCFHLLESWFSFS
ncbi:hypothetical protein CDAR_109791 [Caerostris darwini]|uniref:Uncharacterized protein n=1 Tax=Caerostris darwini TaxID=1538125 RepID=A0AAV4SS84_9ARAC|nr:hypothetical protein CDAR_109791 [Caerostris darwini]